MGSHRTSKHTPSKQALLHRSTAQVILKMKTPAPPQRRSSWPRRSAAAAAARASPAVRFRHSTWARSPFQPAAGATSMRVFLRAGYHYLKQLMMLFFDKSKCSPRGSRLRVLANFGSHCAWFGGTDYDRLRKSSRARAAVWSGELVCPHTEICHSLSCRNLTFRTAAQIFFFLC